VPFVDFPVVRRSIFLVRSSLNLLAEIVAHLLERFPLSFILPRIKEQRACQGDVSPFTIVCCLSPRGFPASPPEPRAAQDNFGSLRPHSSSDESRWRPPFFFLPPTKVLVLLKTPSSFPLLITVFVYSLVLGAQLISVHHFVTDLLVSPPW